jgi:rubrerythrin
VGSAHPTITVLFFAAMKNSKKAAKKQEIFDSLVRNATDFLERSIIELEDSPKFSIINFCTSIELFLKARLMHEHWTLIYEDPRDAKIDSFLQGKFKSVSIETSIKRLKYAVDLKITREEEKTFKNIRDHRNQLVHFFNESYDIFSKSNEIEIIAQEECKGWFYLSRIIKNRWKEEFSDYVKTIEKLDESMLKVRNFLSAKYQALLPQLEVEQKKGTVFYPCFVCGFLAREEVVDKEFFQPDKYLSTLSFCHVCNTKTWDTSLRIKCPNCEDGNIMIYDLGEGECRECNQTVDLNYLLERYAEIKYVGSGDFEFNRAYCSCCEYLEQPTVVPFNDVWLCLSCLETHDSADFCGYCQQPVTGNVEDSFLEGCMFCEGQMGHYMNSRAYAD